MAGAGGIRVLICGGRQFADAEYLTQALDVMLERRGPFAIVIHGAAQGADSMAGAWAVGRRIPVQEFPAQWNAFKKRGSEVVRSATGRC